MATREAVVLEGCSEGSAGRPAQVCFNSRETRTPHVRVHFSPNPKGTMPDAAEVLAITGEAVRGPEMLWSVCGWVSKD
eukprot:1140558-Pelagomonas_calceolata.AAC.5